MKQKLVRTLLSRPPAPGSFVLALVLFGIIWLATEAYWGDWLGSSQFFPSIPNKVFEHKQYWRLFTSTFAHADPEHLLSNGYMFVILSTFLIGYFGIGTVLFAFFILAPLTHGIALWSYEPNIKLIGASGLVYVLAGAWLFLYFLVDRSRNLSMRGLRVVGVGLLILFPTKFEASVSYRTHVIGLLLGIPYGVFIYVSQRQKIRAAEFWKIVDETQIPDESLNPPTFREMSAAVEAAQKSDQVGNKE